MSSTTHLDGSYKIFTRHGVLWVTVKDGRPVDSPELQALPYRYDGLLLEESEHGLFLIMDLSDSYYGQPEYLMTKLEI